MGVNVSRRMIMGSALLGAAGLAASGCVQGEANAPQAASSHLPANLFGPPPGAAQLSRNENPYGPSPRVLAAVADATRAGAYYADTSYLAAMIAEKNGVEPSQVVLSTGSAEALCATALAFGAQGAILCPSLFWDTTALYAAQKGATLKRVPLTADLQIDLPAMEAAVGGDVALVHLCNPNNPTGTLLDSGALRGFCERVSTKAPVLVDEAYNELTSDPEGNSMLNLVRAGNNVIVARTFSKIYGMAGMRIGYMITTPENAELIRSYVMSWMSAPSIAAAVASYNDEDFLAYSKSKVTEAREMVSAAVTGAGLTHLPSETNFMYVRVDDADAMQAAMAERGVFIRPAYGDFTHWSRVSMGKIEDVERYVGALPEIVGA